MKSRSSLPKIVIIVLVILLAVLSLWLSTGRYPNYIAKGGVKNNPQSIVFIPKRSPLMVSLLVNPDKLGVMANLLPSNDEQKRVLKSIKQLRTKLLIQAQVDSSEDLQTWLGEEITLAVTSLDYDHDRDNGIKPGYLLVVKNKSSELAREFLQTYYGKQAVSNNAQLILDEYKGVKLVYQKPLTPDVNIKQIAAAVVGDFVLFANDIQVLKESINNSQAVDLNLAHDLAYQKAIESLPKEKVSIAYLNLPSTSAWITNQGEVTTSYDNQSLTVSLSLNPQGLVTHTALSGITEEKNQTPKLTTPPQTLAYIPDDSIFSVAGFDLQGFWQEIIAELDNNNPLPQLLYQGIHPLEESLNVNFAEDIFPQVTGEYGLSLSINEKTKQLDWLFINQNSLTDTYKLDNLAKERGLSVGTLPLNNNTITAWTKLITTSDNNFSRLEAEVKGVHTKKESYEILTNSVNVLNGILTNPTSNLLESPQFRSSIKALPTENDGYLYLQWQPLKPYLVQKFPIVKIAELGFKPLFDNLQSLTIVSEGVESGVRKGTIFFNLSISK
ncbi:DUF3352 domain-containing protein [Geminocystis sp. NIES-3709]|uniref:DUF3352 domain-containing protein n=1 Tax=Geminocystis sp. NIES-3709 TaxID=1617448 RepID=UPI0005FC42C4|nr:DUF3352 domain-containing protein [Geminocystis sp. NIES-3709]BAQ65604.1 hypothetical protein GM3709_2369 [Geminocystis sp. NIES-3709]